MMIRSLSRGRDGAALILLAATLAGCYQDKVTAPNTKVNGGGCDAATAPTLAVGGVSSSLSGTSICLNGGSTGAQYALVVFNGSATAANAESVTLTPAGVTTTSGALTDVVPTTGSALALGMVPNTAFHDRLRASERLLARTMIPAARLARQSGATGPRFDMIPSNLTVGQYIQLNSNANDACSNLQNTTARVVAISNKAIVVADTSNPPGGYTDAEYTQIASDFDNIVDAVDENNFGAPSDIDNNGHVLLFFTKAVNALTPKNSTSYVGGFFWARDLFPQAGTNACATSNYGEMFYLLVPDSSGKVNGHVFTKSQVTPIALSTTAHEFQHLINASRRIYVNNANDFEETWLDEGLAHIAEELLFYKEAGLAPRMNLSANTLRSSQTYVDAFNQDQSANFGRFEEYLKATAKNSPYAANDSLATRGSTWDFLRYATDHKGAPDSVTWHALVNSTVTGRANLANVFGSDLTSLFRDWSTSIIADDVGAAPAAYQQPSWNFRSIYDVLVGSYPLKTTDLTNGTAVTVAPLGGSAAYARVTLSANSTGSVSWGTVPADIQVSLVRLK